MSRTTILDEEKSSSGFFITLREMDILDKYVVVGEVFKGMHELSNLNPEEGDIKILSSGIEKELIDL